MSRSDPQLNIRIPVELKERVELAAKESGRSVTSEIINRLSESFNKDSDNASTTLDYVVEMIEELKNKIEFLNDVFHKK